MSKGLGAPRTYSGRFGFSSTGTIYIKEARVILGDHVPTFYAVQGHASLSSCYELFNLVDIKNIQLLRPGAGTHTGLPGPEGVEVGCHPSVNASKVTAKKAALELFSLVNLNTFSPKFGRPH